MNELREGSFTVGMNLPKDHPKEGREEGFQDAPSHAGDRVHEALVRKEPVVVLPFPELDVRRLGGLVGGEGLISPRILIAFWMGSWVLTGQIYTN